MPSSWPRVGKQIEAARSRRWPTRDEFAEVTRVGKRTLVDLENGRRDNFSDRTLTPIEAALGWPDGEIRRRVEGGKPRKLADPDLVRLGELWPRLSTEVRHVLLDAAERHVERKLGL